MSSTLERPPPIEKGPITIGTSRVILHRIVDILQLLIHTVNTPPPSPHADALPSSSSTNRRTHHPSATSPFSSSPATRASAAESLLGAGTATEGETPPTEHLPLLLGVNAAASTGTPNRRTALWEHAGAQRNKSLANANVAALKEQLTRGLPSSSGAGGGPTAGCIHRCKQSNAHPYHGRFLPVLIRNLGRCCERLETSSSC